jgi:hypothetical protein
MMTFAKFKQYIAARVDAVTSGILVYNTKPPINVTSPYIVITYPSSDNESEIREDWIVEMNFWNKSTTDSIDSTSVLIAVEAVKTSFNCGWQSENDGFFRSYLDFAGEIPDPEPQVYRYQQRYQVKLY